MVDSTRFQAAPLQSASPFIHTWAPAHPTASTVGVYGLRRACATERGLRSRTSAGGIGIRTWGDIGQIGRLAVPYLAQVAERARGHAFGLGSRSETSRRRQCIDALQTCLKDLRQMLDQLLLLTGELVPPLAPADAGNVRHAVSAEIEVVARVVAHREVPEAYHTSPLPLSCRI